jgi:quinol monooxygenase YgiN
MTRHSQANLVSTMVSKGNATCAGTCGTGPTALFDDGEKVIVSTTRVTIRPDKRSEFFQTVRRLVDTIKDTKGCLTFRLYIDAADENSSLLMSEWESELALNNYIHSNDFAILRGAITVLSTRCDELRALVTRQQRLGKRLLSSEAVVIKD